MCERQWGLVVSLGPRAPGRTDMDVHLGVLLASQVMLGKSLSLLTLGGQVYEVRTMEAARQDPWRMRMRGLGHVRPGWGCPGGGLLVRTAGGWKLCPRTVHEACRTLVCPPLAL